MPVFLRLMKIVKKFPVRSAVSIRQHPANTQSEAIRNAQQAKQAILAEVVNVTKILILHQAASPSSSCGLPFHYDRLPYSRSSASVRGHAQSKRRDTLSASHAT